MKICGDLYRRTVLCVDSYEECNPSGSLYHPHCQNGISFRSLTQFLLQMEKLLNDMDYPQAFMTPRCFGDPQCTHTVGLPDTAVRQGRLATFQIRILFRQNASWQGEILWQEKEQMHSFRSVLELIRLLDSALQTAGADTEYSA